MGLLGADFKLPLPSSERQTEFGLTYFPGYFSVLAAQLTGPGEMSGVLGQSVSVPCQYMENYQTKKKYWCRGENWESCSKVVESTGSEDEVRQGRVSLRDNHFLHTFTVTLENLTLEDMGTYWCGINQFGQDLNAPVKVTVFPGESLRALPSCWKIGVPGCGETREGVGLEDRLRLCPHEAVS